MPATHTATIQKILQRGGFDHKQAQSITEAILEAQSGSDFVTNASLDLRLKELELRLTTRMIAVVGVAVAILALLIEF